MGLIGVLFMPFVGAVIGRYIAQKNPAKPPKVGLATWLGLIVGTIVKLVLVFMMIGILLPRWCSPAEPGRPTRRARWAAQKPPKQHLPSGLSQLEATAGLRLKSTFS